jgi:hypothetical protein
MAWKTAQTLAEALSGIASAARLIVQRLQQAGLDVPVACTRKNFPGTRALAAKAVRSGGAVMHRLGLSETLLVFPEHRAFNAATDLAAAVAGLRRSQPEKRVVVEVGSADEAMAMARAGADFLVSSAPYFAPPADIRVRLQPPKPDQPLTAVVSPGPRPAGSPGRAPCHRGCRRLRCAGCAAPRCRHGCARPRSPLRAAGG